MEHYSALRVPEGHALVDLSESQAPMKVSLAFGNAIRMIRQVRRRYSRNVLLLRGAGYESEVDEKNREDTLPACRVNSTFVMKRIGEETNKQRRLRWRCHSEWSPHV